MQKRCLLRRAKECRWELEDGAGHEAVPCLVKLQHQAAGVVTAGQEYPAPFQDQRRRHCGDAYLPVERLPEERAVLRGDADDTLVGAIDIHALAPELHRSEE